MASHPISNFGYAIDLDTSDLSALLKPLPTATPEQRKRRAEVGGNTLAQNFMILSPLTLLAACGGGGGGGVTPPPPPPPPPPASFTGTADTASVTASATTQATVTGNVVTNDTPNTATVTAVVAGSSPGTGGVGTAVQGSIGTLNVASTGAYTYTVTSKALGAGQTGTDVFTYTAANGTASGSTTLTVTVTGVNDAPTPVADQISASVGGAAVTTTTRAAGLLGNDTDPDTGQTTTLTVTAVGAGTATPTGGVGTAITGSAGGRLTVAADGTYTYTPPATGSGSETFTYVVSDGTLTATQTVTVNLAGVLGSTISLTGLNGTNGFSITGAPTGVGAELGASVAVGAGVTGTGNSIVIGAPGVGTDAGRVYILTGTGSGGAATLNIGTAAGVVQINGGAANDRAGTSVDIGGLNTDSLADVLIGAPGTNGNQGTGYVVFGAASPATSLSALSAAQGFTTVGNGNSGSAYTGGDTAGVQTGDNAGYLARYLGSINGDANADFLFALPGFDIGGQASGNDSGAAIIGYGASFANRAFTDFLGSSPVNGFIATIDNSALEENSISDATSGNLNETGGTATTRDLVLASSKFDFNPGGGGAVRADAGQVNVLYSTINPQGGTFDGAAISGTNGYRVGGATAGDRLGAAVAVGDLNGDGIGDLVIGAPGADANGTNSGAIYIVYGQTAAITNSGTIDLSSLTGASGTISGATVVRVAGGAASQGFGSDLAIGDFNGDGRADIAVGSDTTGDAWIIFGRGATNMALVNVATPTAGNVVLIDGPAASGTNYRLSLDAGSVNSDSFADLVIGATADNADGAVYVVYGANAGGQVPTSLDAILADAPASVDSIIDAAVGGLGGQRSGGFSVTFDAPIQVGADFPGLEDISSAMHINVA
jgi:VCBS repeat-containing protein